MLGEDQSYKPIDCFQIYNAAKKVISWSLNQDHPEELRELAEKHHKPMEQLQAKLCAI